MFGEMTISRCIASHRGGHARFEETERDTQEKLQIPFHDGKEVQQLTTEYKEIIGEESVNFLKQYNDNMMERRHHR